MTLRFTLAHSKGQRQCSETFDCERFNNCDGWGKRYYLHQIGNHTSNRKSHMDFQFAVYYDRGQL